MSQLQSNSTSIQSNSPRPQAINESIIRNIETDLKNAIQVFESEKIRLNARIDDLTAQVYTKDQEIEHLKLSSSVEIEILENQRKQLAEAQQLVLAENPKELKNTIQNLEIENKRLQVDQNHKDLVIERLEQTLHKEMDELRNRENTKVAQLEKEMQKQQEEYRELQTAYKELEHLKDLQLDQNQKDLVIQRLEQALEKEITEQQYRENEKVAALEIQLTKSTENFATLQNALRDLEQKYKLVTTTDIPCLESKITQLTAENELFQSKMIEKERELQMRTRELSEVKSDRKQNKKVVKRISDLERSISSNQPNINDFQKQLQETALRLAGLEEQLSQASVSRSQIKNSARKPRSVSKSRLSTRSICRTPTAVTPKKRTQSKIRLSRHS